MKTFILFIITVYASDFRKLLQNQDIVELNLTQQKIVGPLLTGIQRVTVIRICVESLKAIFSIQNTQSRITSTIRAKKTSTYDKTE